MKKTQGTTAVGLPESKIENLNHRIFLVAHLVFLYSMSNVKLLAFFIQSLRLG